ncbi:uncharacterized protein LOC122663100 [Telopea speciosissima]|uniref:uncharacterized protein LOC122663100 n=1 Tax=Telopea speciosissima TaxID=54955 RepID=UPI001CC421CD|nr:uncharacterized protein LOC122663100 [Telopea speciosissima]
MDVPLVFSSKKNHGKNNADHTLFIKKNGELITVLIVYVDDIMVTGSDISKIARLKLFLYTLDLLSNTRMLGCKSADTLLEENSHQKQKDGELMDKGGYQRHLEVVYQILRYLKSALGRGVLFSPYDHLCIEAYTNADWVGSHDDR